MGDGSINRTFDLFRLAYELCKTNYSKDYVMKSLENKSKENLKWQDLSIEERSKRFEKIFQYVTHCSKVEGTCQHVSIWS